MTGISRHTITAETFLASSFPPPPSLTSQSRNLFQWSVISGQ
nr:MAG TPA: hypothetical protein [Caudoviricetes sp.]